MNVPFTDFSVFYNNRNITNDISKYLISLQYTDKVAGESDEVQIKLEDVDTLWQNGWYPEKGAKLTVKIARLNCGVFEIDQIDIEGPPSTVTIRGIATGITGSLRTRKSDAHENKTLRQIVDKVAKSNNLTVSGEIPDVLIGRETQNKETDLSFLKRVAEKYGVVFSVRDNTITFTSVFSLETRSASFSLNVSDLKNYRFSDKADPPKSSKSVHGNAKKNARVEVNQEFEDYKKKEGYTAPSSVSGDTSVNYGYSENKQQSELKAKSVMHVSASNQFEGNFSIQGNELACAGNNVGINGLGNLSGVYHIKTSTHTIDKSSGYTTECEVKRTQVSVKSNKITSKRPKTKPSDVAINPFPKDYIGNIERLRT